MEGGYITAAGITCSETQGKSEFSTEGCQWLKFSEQGKSGRRERKQGLNAEVVTGQGKDIRFHSKGWKPSNGCKRGT